MYPANIPAIKQLKTPKNQLSSRIFMVTAPATPAKPITEPIDKSNPAELITNVAPIARIPITEVASKIFNMFEMLRKYGDKKVIVKKSNPRTYKDSTLILIIFIINFLIDLTKDNKHEKEAAEIRLL